MIWKWDGIKKHSYEDVFRSMDREKIKYLLIGGVAAILHGVPRSTADIDIMLLMTRENIKKFIGIMDQYGYKPKVPVKPIELADPKKRKYWQKKKNMKAFSFQHPDDPFMVIDVVINDPVDFEKAFDERQIFDQWDAKISVVSVETLIELKKMAGRPQDLSDIKMIRRIQELRDEEKM